MHIYTHTYIHKLKQKPMHTYTCMHAHVYAHMHTLIRKPMHTYNSMHAHIYKQMNTCMCSCRNCMHAHIHTNTCIYKLIQKLMHIYTCMNVYICTQTHAFVIQKPMNSYTETRVHIQTHIIHSCRNACICVSTHTNMNTQKRMYTNSYRTHTYRHVDIQSLKVSHPGQGQIGDMAETQRTHMGGNGAMIRLKPQVHRLQAPAPVPAACR